MSLKRSRTASSDELNDAEQEWPPGREYRSLAVVDAAKRNPSRAVSWARSVLEVVTRLSAREQRNLVVVMIALSSRFDREAVDAAEKGLRDSFAKNTLRTSCLAKPTSEGKQPTELPMANGQLQEPVASPGAAPSSPMETEQPAPLAEVAVEPSAEGVQTDGEMPQPTAEDAQADGEMRQPSAHDDEAGEMQQHQPAAPFPGSSDGRDGPTSAHLELLESLDQWGKRGDAARRIEPPSAALKAMAISTSADTWAAVMNPAGQWPEQAVAMLVERILTEEGTGLRMAQAIAKNAIAPRLLTLEASATRELMSSTVLLCSSFPRVVLDVMFPEILPHLNTPMAEVIARVCHDVDDNLFSIRAIEALCESPWIEPSLKILEDLYIRAKSDSEAIALIAPAISRNSHSFRSSVRFAKLVTIVINQTAPQDLDPHREVIRVALSRCTSFLAKTTLKKFAKR